MAYNTRTIYRDAMSEDQKELFDKLIPPGSDENAMSDNEQWVESEEVEDGLPSDFFISE